MKKLLLVPEGGLGNRMRAIAGAVALARRAGCELEVVWFQDPELCVPICSLFEGIDCNGVTVREATALDYLLHRRPRPRNLGIPQLMQRLRFKSRIYAPEAQDLITKHFDFVQWCSTEGKKYLHTYSRVVDTEPELMAELFVPAQRLMQRIDERCRDFGEYCVGVHVRRTDHDMAINASPLELFYEQMDAELNTHPEARFYLATDSDEVRKQMSERYGSRLIVANSGDRNSRQGMDDALVEMYALARTNKILGSYKSTFSQIASELGRKPITVVANRSTDYRL